MQHFLLAISAFLFSFAHTAPAPKAVAAEPTHPTIYASYTPTRQQLARADFSSNPRAIQACVSCRRIDASYTSR